MNTYLLFLLGLFVAGGFAPQLVKSPRVVLFLCFLLCLSIYTGKSLV